MSELMKAEKICRSISSGFWLIRNLLVDRSSLLREGIKCIELNIFDEGKNYYISTRQSFFLCLGNKIRHLNCTVCQSKHISYPLFDCSFSA